MVMSPPSASFEEDVIRLLFSMVILFAWIVMAPAGTL